MEKEDLFMLMGMSMKEIGSMIKQRVMGDILTWMEHNMKGFGEKISSMEKVKNHGQTVRCMKEIIYMERSMELGSLNGQMVQFMKDSLGTII